MKFVIYNLGCKVNQYEGESIATMLRREGHEVVYSLQGADCYIINTCAVTNEAEAKSRRIAARASRLGGDIIVLGCSAEVNPTNFNSKIVGGTDNKIETVREYLQGRQGDAPMPSRAHRTREYLKIQDGCNSFCSYCIVPYARNKLYSKPIDQILEEIEGISAREIVLTGINTSSYNDGGRGLVELISALPRQGKRFRISSLEQGIITREFMEAFCSAPMCHHLHLSLQSGCDRVLSAMNRRYTAEQYLQKVRIVREYLPDAAITTDIIAGFPTETETEHAATLQFVGEVGFADIHVFAYSQRAGTQAAQLAQVAMDVRRRRAGEISSLAKELRREYLQRFVGKRLSVLAESKLSGTSQNYITVYGSFKTGQLYDVVAEELYLDGVRGKNEGN